MRIIIFQILLLLTFCKIAAQNQEPTLDNALININKSTVNSGIIYERTMQLANLYNFNREEGFDSANYKYFRQVLLEMHNASNYL
jgi:hypothetical protein